MAHNEDEQPNESVYGRRKHILPFVKNTSRIQGRQSHQFPPILVPVPHIEPIRGRGYNRGRGQDRGHGRGQGRNRGRGGFPHHPPAPQLPQFKEVNPWAELDALREHTPQPTTPESSTPPRSSFNAQPGPSSNHPPLEVPKVEVAGGRVDEWAPGPSMLGPQPPIRPFQGSKRPRKRFHPGKNGKHKYDSGRSAVDTGTLAVELSADRQTPQETILFSHDDDDNCPPAKRPRIKEEEVSSSYTALSVVARGKSIKPEIEDDLGINLLQEKLTSGTKFVSYDDHPMCRFNCGELPSQVRKHRKVLKGREVQALRDQGREVLAAFIRDDGIAIDWVISTKGATNTPTHKSGSPIIILDDPEPPPPEEVALSTPPPPSQVLPSHLNPLILSADKFDDRCSSTPITTIETAYREVLIPPRHLPRDGNTRKLEIWALEQMRLLEAELGPVILPPPELIGIGEYITGQRLSEGVRPHIKIYYKRTVCVRQSSVEPSTGREETFSLAEFMGKSSPTSPRDSSVTPTLPIEPPEPTLPLVAHLGTPPSSPIPNSPFPIKSEVDELADHPPSVPASPGLTHPTENVHIPIPSTGNLDENTRSEPQSEIDEGIVQTTSEDRNGDSDELQRLRRDLELSKLEAERKHRELEQRILELSQKHSEMHRPRPNVEEPPTTVRIVDEGKPTILPLRRGKYDKTRRLLGVSDSTVLHISWLGVMQLIGRDSRRIVATGFGSDVPSNISVEDACSLSPSATALALSGSESQVAIATLGEGNFSFLPLRDQPHDSKGVCSIAPVDLQSATTLGHDHRYVHWKFQPGQCSTDLLPLPKLYSCTALAFDPVHSNIVTAGSESNKRSKLTLYNLVSKEIPNTVELSNHPHHIHVDPDNPFLLLLELARLDDQFQVHDIRMPLYQCVQKFGYQNIVHEKAEFRVRGKDFDDPYCDARY